MRSLVEHFAMLRPHGRFADLWWSRHQRREFRSRRPVTLNEKIRYRMAVDRRGILTLLADKFAVRDYVSSCVGPEILTSVFAIMSDPRDIPWDALPSRYVIKATHGSGATIVVDDREPLTSTLPLPDPSHPWGVLARVHPSRVERLEVEDLANSWLASNYWRFHGVTEWAYRDVPPRLVVEELLDDGRGNIPPDYKFWCFNGRVSFIQVDLDRMHDHRRSLHLPDWRLIDGQIHYPLPEVAPERPARLRELIEVAEALAAGLDFVRVDLYSLIDRVVFGELTNYPGIGREIMTPEAIFTQFAEGWDPAPERR